MGNLGFERGRRQRGHGHGVTRNLYLVQTYPSQPINNWPQDVPMPASPHALRHRYGQASRRRLRARRPLPTLQSVPLPPNEALEQMTGVSSSLQDLGISLEAGESDMRERSRSRDGPPADWGVNWPSSSSTSTSTSTTTSAVELHGDAYTFSAGWLTSTWSSSGGSTTASSSTTYLHDREMNFANTADAVDVAQRLLAASRRLLRQQQRLNLALEEALLWFPVPPAAPVLNGPTMALNIVAEVMGDSMDPPNVEAQNEGVAVLLQPGLPPDGHAIRQRLPGWPPECSSKFSTPSVEAPRTSASCTRVAGRGDS